MKKRQNIGLILGIFVLIVFTFMPNPEGMTTKAKYAAGVTLLMAIWWITEAISIYITAFVPLALFPLFGVLSASDTAENYGNNLVLLFLGGLIIARSIEKQNLHKRIALSAINLVGVNRQKIILSFMIVTALLSMWIANVAVTLLMFPIALAIIKKEESTLESSSRFGVALMLAIAYSSSIGGSSNIVGTPPNMVFAGILNKLFPQSPEITFLYWLKIGLPILIVLLPITWYYLIKHFKIKGGFAGGDTLIREEYKALGPMSKGEKRVSIIFILTALGWIFRKDIEIGDFTLPGWSGLFGNPNMIHDNTVAMLSVLALFSVAAGDKGERLLDWKTVSTIPWGVVIIVGGGYAIASAFKSTGLSEWIGNELSYIGKLPLFLMILMILAIVTFLTEINSNTATANIFLPVLATMAMAAEVNPLLLMIPATFACSMAFMLPSGTGPNTVIFASERVSMSQMVRCGLWLNFIVIVILALLFYFILIPLLGIDMTLPGWAE